MVEEQPIQSKDDTHCQIGHPVGAPIVDQIAHQIGAAAWPVALPRAVAIPRILDLLDSNPLVVDAPDAGVVREEGDDAGAGHLLPGGDLPVAMQGGEQHLLDGVHPVG